MFANEFFPVRTHNNNAPNTTTLNTTTTRKHTTHHNNYSFDCVSTLAEEVKNPKVDMPVGIVGCISFVTLIYCVRFFV